MIARALQLLSLSFLSAPALADGSSSSMTPQEKLDRLRTAFQEVSNESDVLYWVLGGVAVIVVALLLVRLCRNAARQRAARRPDYLRLAAGLLKLTDEERRTIQWVATQAGVREPVSIVLTPANLAQAMACIGGAGVEPRVRRCLNGISERLFGVGLPGAAPPKAGDH